MSTRIICVQPLVLHLCIGRLLHLQTFTFAHWQTFASADLHFSTFPNTYFLWNSGWSIHVNAKVWNVCYTQFCRIATWVDCIHKITNWQILEQHRFNSFFMSLGGQRFFLLQFPEFMRFAVVRKLWKAWLFFLPDNRENTLIPLQSPVINTPF